MTQAMRDNESLTWEIPEEIVDQFNLQANARCPIVLRHYADDVLPARVTWSGQNISDIRDNLSFRSHGSKLHLKVKQGAEGSVTVFLPPSCRKLFASLSGGCSLESRTLNFQEMHLRLRDSAYVKAGATHLPRATVKAIGFQSRVIIGGECSRFGHVQVLAVGGATIALKGSFQSLSAKMFDHEMTRVASHLYINGPVHESLRVKAEGGGVLHLPQPSILPPVCEISIKPVQPFSAFS